MLGKRLWKWQECETGKSRGEHGLVEYGIHPNCPNCGKPTEYDEFQTGQDEMGNDEYGWHYICWNCAIATQTE